jgi:23S rRNA (pseudouridine1915-N3)-methyltransferase
VQREGEAILAQVPRDDCLVALDVTGKRMSTETLAQRLASLRDEGRHLTLMVGGPDGLSQACLGKAAERWSLSDLTLPHPLVRIVVAEQLYRTWSILTGHPYHRA